MPSSPSITPLEFGLVGFVLILMWQVLQVGKQFVLSSKQTKREMPACHYDPAHFQRIQEIHEFARKSTEQVNQGEFSCQWKDREEVRDYMELQRRQIELQQRLVDTTEAMTAELKLLTSEFVRTRQEASNKRRSS